MCLVMVLLRALSLLPHSRGVGVPAAAPTPAIGAPPPASANGQPLAAVNGVVAATAAGNGAATGARPPMRWTNNTSGFVLRRISQLIQTSARADKGSRRRM